jgi:hypothetical protein
MWFEDEDWVRLNGDCFVGFALLAMTKMSNGTLKYTKN